MNRLKIQMVKALRVAGRHAYGGGLYLLLDVDGSKRWVYRAARGGKPWEIELGSVADLELRDARIAARKFKAEIRGVHNRTEEPRETALPRLPPFRILSENPLVECVLGSGSAAKLLTFGKFADCVIKDLQAGWLRPATSELWRNTLSTHAASLQDIAVDELGADDILSVLAPIWYAKPTTALHLRWVIQRILDAAIAAGVRSGDNPARWRGHLAVLLPRRAHCQTKSASGRY
jgi:hypothetical protein